MPRRSNSLHHDLQGIGKAFKALSRHFERIAPLLGEHADVIVAPPVKRARRKPRLSARHRAQLKLQGTYMGTMRGLSPRKRSFVKRVRAQKGIKAAIAAARKIG